MRAPEGTSRSSTLIAAERIATGLRTLPGVILTNTTISNDTEESANLATIYVQLTDPKERKLTAVQMMDQARDQVIAKQPKGLTINVAQSFGGPSTMETAPTGLPPHKSNVVIITDPKELEDLAKRARKSNDSLAGALEKQVPSVSKPRFHAGCRGRPGVYLPAISSTRAPCAGPKQRRQREDRKRSAGVDYASWSQSPLHSPSSTPAPASPAGRRLSPLFSQVQPAGTAPFASRRPIVGPAMRRRLAEAQARAEQPAPVGRRALARRAGRSTVQVVRGRLLPAVDPRTTTAVRRCWCPAVPTTGATTRPPPRR
jgi:hypothetical protein